MAEGLKIDENRYQNVLVLCLGSRVTSYAIFPAMTGRRKSDVSESSRYGPTREIYDPRVDESEQSSLPLLY